MSAQNFVDEFLWNVYTRWSHCGDPWDIQMSWDAFDTAMEHRIYGELWDPITALNYLLWDYDAKYSDYLEDLWNIGL